MATRVDDIRQHLPQPRAHAGGGGGGVQQQQLVVQAGPADDDEQQAYDGSSYTRAQDPPGSDDATSAEEGDGSTKERADVLQDGVTRVGTCLWAVQLRLAHPASGQLLDVSCGSWPERMYRQVCVLEAPAPAG
jgi:hypothetical protein